MALSSSTKQKSMYNFTLITSWKPAVSIDLFGNRTEFQCFERDSNTEATACSITWDNKMHLFGGSLNRRQISRLSGLKLEYLKSLSFDHNGACSVTKDAIFLCFSDADKNQKLCRRANGPLKEFTEVSESVHNHKWIEISSSDGK